MSSCNTMCQVCDARLEGYGGVPLLAPVSHACLGLLGQEGQLRSRSAPVALGAPSPICRRASCRADFEGLVGRNLLRHDL